jgi:signal recognition particle subunit SRP72
MGQKSKANAAPAKGKPPPAKEKAPGDVKKEQTVEPSGPTVDDLFVTLDKYVRADDFKNIVKLSDQILAKEPQCVEAKQCKVVALIQENQISDALQVIEASKTPGLDLTYQKAYCLYRLSRLSEALAVLKGVERSVNVLQLEAQILYRKGELKECMASYESLFRQHKVDANDVKTNMVAAYVAGGRAAEVPSLMESLKVQPRTGFELAHNAACALIEKEEYGKAEELLQLAHRIGQEALIEEDVPEEDIEDDLAPISVQLAYVQQMQGRFDEALESYNAILKKKPADAPSLAVATNNLIAVKGARDLFDALKKTEKLLEKKDAGQKLQFAENLENRLSMRQKEALSFNRCLLLLHSNKLDQARDFASSLSKTFPDSSVPAVLSASLLLKEGKAQKADELLADFAEKHADAGTNVHFVRAQAAAASGNYLQAAKCLELITSLRHKPGMIATLVALKGRGGNAKGAESVLDEAVEYWDSYMGDEDRSSMLEAILQEAATFKLKHNKMEAAAKLYERLMKSPSPVVRSEALHGLVSSYAYTNPDKAAEYEKKLPPLGALSGLDVESLEKVPPWSLNVKRGRAVEETGEKTGEDRSENVKTKKKRKRKPLYPKGFDPANPGPPPDPERWLPRKERSSYRPKKGKRNQAPIRGSQGSVSREKSGDLNAAASNGPSADSGKTAGGSKTSAPAEIPKPNPPAHRGKKKGRH